MLLPRFSLRTLLLVCVGVAVASLFAGQAATGRAWAVGVTAAVLSVPIALTVQALVFAACSGVGRILGVQETTARTSRGGVERPVPPVDSLETIPAASTAADSKP
jgi:hypothetical protein